MLIWGKAKNSIFKELGEHWLGFSHLKRECRASFNVRELTREKKVDMGENLQPKDFHKLNARV